MVHLKSFNLQLIKRVLAFPKKGAYFPFSVVSGGIVGNEKKKKGSILRFKKKKRKKKRMQEMLLISKVQRTKREAVAPGTVRDGKEKLWLESGKK